MLNAQENLLKPRMIKELGKQDKAWMAKARRYGLDILRWYSKSDTVTPLHLDDAFQAWKKDRTDNRAPHGMIISGFGVLFGDYIVQHKNAKWIIVSNCLGKSLAVLSSQSRAVYPINSVASKVDRNSKKERFFKLMWAESVEKSFK